MPFFQPPKTPRWKYKTGAYRTLQDLGSFLGGIATTSAATPHSLAASASPTNIPSMGRRSQKTRTPAEGRDIGAMLQRPAQPKPTTTNGQPDKVQNPTLQQHEPESLQYSPTPMAESPESADDTAPTTKKDLELMLAEIHKLGHS
ncbi:Hypothetical predicted protein [Pelobates cultripes]|uniref:Uncharacterized protein n=1 Tax=Pelobates cultripes TaxID=61616 RepID=A0AAD1QZ50_PELCU|nr:Hypothetical predicted protein [Pelobates cultripes]